MPVRLTVFSDVGLILSKKEMGILMENYQKKLKQYKCNKRVLEIIENFKEPYNLMDPILKSDSLSKLQSRIEEIFDKVYVTMTEKYTIEEIMEARDILIKNSFMVTYRDADRFQGKWAIYFYKTFDEVLNSTCYASKEILSDIFVIYPTKPTLPQAILAKESYQSIDELVDEYRTGLSGYLPDDFNYLKHIALVEMGLYA